MGIVPYIPAELHTIHLSADVVRDGGRLVAAPTGARHSLGRGCKPTWRGDVGIAPYISVRPRTVQLGTSIPSGFGRLAQKLPGKSPEADAFFCFSLFYTDSMVLPELDLITSRWVGILLSSSCTWLMMPIMPLDLRTLSKMSMAS